MKRLILTVTTIALTLSFSACDNRTKPRQKPVPGPRQTPYDTAYDTGASPPEAPVERTRSDLVDPAPASRNEKIPPPPKPQTPEYAIKAEGKPGYVKSPYDPQGRLIDVRGLPPGTEAEDPYTRRSFLVPP
jgi:hypothetical protein